MISVLLVLRYSLMSLNCVHGVALYLTVTVIPQNTHTLNNHSPEATYFPSAELKASPEPGDAPNSTSKLV